MVWYWTISIDAYHNIRVDKHFCLLKKRLLYRKKRCFINDRDHSSSAILLINDHRSLFTVSYQRRKNNGDQSERLTYIRLLNNFISMPIVSFHYILNRVN
jgi:hypothetical protein